MDKLFNRGSKVIAFSPLQIAEGLAEGLQELTEAEKQAHFNPVVEEAERDYKHLTGLAKLNLFTPAEQRAVIAAVYVGDVEVAVFYERFKIADYVTYSNPETEAGLSLLVHKGLITAARKAEIVDALTAERQ